MSFVYIRMSLVCHPLVTRMYLYVIHMSLVCTRMGSVGIHMYSYAARMPVVCTRMSPVCRSSVVLP